MTEVITVFPVVPPSVTPSLPSGVQGDLPVAPTPPSQLPAGVQGDIPIAPTPSSQLPAGVQGDIPQMPMQVPTAGNQQVGPAQSISQGGSPTASTDNFRIRLSALSPDDVYPANGGILSVLRETDGMLFPYTPQIAYNQAVNYMDLQMVHSNTDYPAYTRTPSVTITVNGKFTVQNQREGAYALAALHFLRTVSKSHFGIRDAEKAGLPPPILVLSGYGNFMFNKLRVILKSHNWTFDENMDTVPVIISGTGGPQGLVRLPPLFSISCELMVVQTPTRMRQVFNFDEFASGKLLDPSMPGWI